MTDHRTPRDRPQVRRRVRRWSVPLASVALATAVVGCTPPPKAACVPGAPRPTLPAGSPWAVTLCRQVSQKPPASVNGVLYRDGVLWLASLVGGEIVAANADTGEIIGRFGPDQGVTSEPDDLAMTADGTIYWSGFHTGDVGVLTPDGHSRTLVNVGKGVNPVVLGPDGALYVNRFDEGTGLYRIDLPSGTPTVLNPDLSLNSFSFGSDGQIYAPTMNNPPSRFLRVDPRTGGSTIVSTDVGLVASSVKFPTAPRKEAATTAYVLAAGLPVAVRRIDITTGQPAAAMLEMPLSLADNMTVAPDGRLFVTAYVPATVVVVGVDGRMTKVSIGHG